MEMQWTEAQMELLKAITKPLENQTSAADWA